MDATELTQEQLETELRKRKAACWGDRETVVTVMIPCRDCWRDLARTLFYLEPGAQSVPLKIVTLDQMSTDVTPRVLAHLGEELKKKGVDYRFLGKAKSWDDKVRNLCLARKRLAEAVDTEFGLFVDADVCMPVGGIRAMVEAFRADENLGMVGIPYVRQTDHIKAGCTMIRHALLVNLDYKGDPCECAYMNTEAKRLGWKIKHLEGWYALHLRDERGLM